MKVNGMRLNELMSKFSTCYASISITGLCEEYRDGLDSLMEESWYKEAQDQEVKGINIIGFDEHSFELCIEI